MLLHSVHPSYLDSFILGRIVNEKVWVCLGLPPTGRDVS